MYIHTGFPQESGDQGQMRQLRLICHLELKGSGKGFRG